MRYLVKLVSGIGDWLVGLSDRARLQLVIGFLLLLGGGGVYKLVVSIENLSKPLPAATPDQLIKPMEKLFLQTKGSVHQYQRRQQSDMKHLDSLAKAYSTK